MEQIYTRHFGYSDRISPELHSKHALEFLIMFGNHCPTYLEVFEWINDNTGYAIFVNLVGHVGLDYNKPPYHTSSPKYRACIFRWGDLFRQTENHFEWNKCADSAIDTLLNQEFIKSEILSRNK